MCEREIKKKVYEDNSRLFFGVSGIEIFRPNRQPKTVIATEFKLWVRFKTLGSCGFQYINLGVI
jgi:hypothetical protein